MFDNPAWAHYLIFRGGRLVGLQLSYPSLSDCQWLERTGGIYATESRWPVTTSPRRRGGRPRKAEAAREQQEAIAA
jgi:hypothetical protein